MATKRRAAKRKKAPKRIDVGDGYALRFDERGPGGDSRFWVGRIFKDRVEVGTFRNDGHGGMTKIEPPSIVEAFRKLVGAHVPEGTPSGRLFECEAWVIDYGEMVGYGRRFLGGKGPCSLANFVRIFCQPNG